MKPKETLKLFKDAAASWSTDQVPTLGAALAYYTLFSIAPLLILTIAVVGAVFGNEAAHGQLSHSLQSVVGPYGAKTIESMIETVNKPGASLLASIIGGITLLIGASGAFSQLQYSLNLIWKVPASSATGWASIKVLIKERIVTFGMVLGIGLLLLVSIIASAVLAAVSKFLVHYLPGGAGLWQMSEVLFSFAVITLLFGMIFKLLPECHVEWRDVWSGSAVTAVLFTIGKVFLGLYLGKSGVTSAYGAAGSVVALLVWVYYSAQIFFFGAEFTRQYALYRGSYCAERMEELEQRSGVQPTGLRRVTDINEKRAVQGKRSSS